MLYRWLRDNDFPPGYRVLCANCNIRAARGVALPNEAKPNIFEMFAPGDFSRF